MGRYFSSEALVLRRCEALLVVCGLLGVTVSSLGCGKGDGPNRLPVYGSITVGGSPTFEGSVTFLPTGETSGPAATTSVVGGSYRFGRHDGPVAGPHRVRIMPREGVTRAPAPQQPGSKGSPQSAVAQTSTPQAVPREQTVTISEPVDAPLDMTF